ncbi:hypothetical protein E2C01_100118 [Portunus trituberculatus]|uniref:Uncharacterized protein n=1 Tax=Portunus trituberculatus TaxID=210409 RepID=A0A5B7K260_PORTR|nr:hypothetical protein [Portunus trituberculatus]
MFHLATINITHECYSTSISSTSPTSFSTMNCLKSKASVNNPCFCLLFYCTFVYASLAHDILSFTFTHSSNIPRFSVIVKTYHCSFHLFDT